MKTLSKFILLVPIFFVLALFLLDLVLFAGVTYPIDVLQTAFSRDVTVGSVSCTNGYTFRAVQRDEANRGNVLEVGSGSSVRTYQVYQLLKDNRLLVGHDLGELNYPYLLRAFPIGRPFSEALVFDVESQILLDERAFGQLIQVPDSIFDDTAFSDLSSCIDEKKTEIAALLSSHHTATAIPVRWLVRTSEPIRDQGGSGYDGTRFYCDDGYVVMLSTSLFAVSGGKAGKIPYTRFNVLDSKGDMYESMSHIRPELYIPSNIPSVLPSNCKNDAGLTLDAFIDQSLSKVKAYK